MLTSCKSAPFGNEVTRVRSQPLRQPTLDVQVIHRMAELEFELLSIVHDHYGHDLPTVTPMYIPIQDGIHMSEICEPHPEVENYCEGPSDIMPSIGSVPYETGPRRRIVQYWQIQ